MPIGMTVAELMANGMSRQDAEHEMKKRVFGADYKVGRDGAVIESGIGSIGSAVDQEAHFAALEKAEGKEAADLARAKAAKRGG